MNALLPRRIGVSLVIVLTFSYLACEEDSMNPERTEGPFIVDLTIVPRLLMPGETGYPARCPTGEGWVAAPASGTGTASYLGAFEDTESVCVNLSTLEFTAGEFVFRNAEGEEIRGIYQGHLEGTPGTADVIGTFELVAGTHRFVGVTGRGTFRGKQQGDGSTRIPMEGTISF